MGLEITLICDSSDCSFIFLTIFIGLFSMVCMGSGLHWKIYTDEYGMEHPPATIITLGLSSALMAMLSGASISHDTLHTKCMSARKEPINDERLLEA